MNPLEQVKKALDEAIAQKKISQEMLHNLGPAIIDVLQPVLSEIAINSKLSKDELLDALSQLNITIPDIEVPHTTVEVKIPDIVVPEPKVTVNVPEIKLPDIVVPEIKVPKAEVNVKVPPIKIPPLKWPEEEMPIKGWVQLMGVDTNNPLPVQLRDAKGNPINLFENLTQIVSGGSGGKHDFFTVKGFSASAYSELTNADGRLRVSVETGGSGITDAELRASAVPVEQVSGANWSVYVTGSTGTIGATIVDSSGVGYSGSNPVPVVVSGSISSTVVTGTTVSDQADDGSAPVKIGGIARTVNPTVVANGDTVSASYDKIGRQLTRMQARDLTVTAYATLTNGTETTLASAFAGGYLDLVYLMGSNNSDVAVTVNIRPVLAGNIVMTLQVPANGVAGIACPLPLPQGDTGNDWTADMGDITGTSVYLTALFSKEI